MPDFTIKQLPGAGPAAPSAEDLLALAQSRPQGYQPSPEEAGMMAQDLAAIAQRQQGAPQAEAAPQFTVKSIPEAAIDTRRGAPAEVRRAVGGASQNDRLATLRQYYPDAQAQGPDNFVFTDPQTKQPTLYNPKGFDFGDLISIAPEASEFAGGVVGGALAAPPAIAGAIPTGGASLLAIPAGIGLGAAGGRELEDLSAKILTRRQDTRSLPQRLTDTAITAGSNAVGARLGDLAVQGVGKVAGPVVRYGRQRLLGTGENALSDFTATGVTPSAGATTGNRAIQHIETGLANTPGGARVMQEQAGRQVAEVQAAADSLARRYATANGANPNSIPRTPEGAGEALKTSAANAGRRFEARQAQLDDAIEQAIGPDTLVPVGASQQLLGELRASLSRAPQSLTPALGQAIERLQALTNDAAQNNGFIPFSALRNVRTMVGRMLQRPDISGYNPAAEASMRRVYGALVQDIETAAAQTGRRAMEAVTRHDRYVRFNRGARLDGSPAPLDRLQKIADAETPAQAFKYALQGSKDGGARLAALRRSMPPEDWDVVAGSVLSRLGRAKPGAQGAAELGDEAGDFSVQSFLTNFRDLSPEAQRALFAGTRYADLAPELNRLVRVVARLKDADKVANSTPGTARTLAIVGALMGTSGLAFGEFKSAAATGIGLVLAPRVAARLITNPRFVAWLADAAAPRMATAHNFAAHLARLGTIATLEPAIREEIGQYIDALRAAPAPQQKRAAGR